MINNPRVVVIMRDKRFLSSVKKKKNEKQSEIVTPTNDRGPLAALKFPTGSITGEIQYLNEQMFHPRNELNF